MDVQFIIIIILLFSHFHLRKIFFCIFSDVEERRDSESSADDVGQHDETASEDDGLSDDPVTNI